ncbi:site-specific recombinase [Azovibrio restrictus]|uniref:site-specific recombinase n=1 Tax=Azovibrio restrictus TaxID=146938 RepID=UPI0026EA7326|nr:site-specific recombinase [Azovibrio restrictus]MDD3482703.1 site-specific recombinase [Azovibrio restrictus]
MEQQLRTLTAGEQDPLILLQELMEQLRPRNPEDIASATARIQSLTFMLEADPGLRRQVREAIETLFSTRKAGSLYVALGILPITGFFSETWRRITHTLLPDVQKPDEYLGDMLQSLFSRKTDEIWVAGVEEEVWITLLKSLHFDEEADPRTLPGGLPTMLHSLWLLSYRMTVIGFDPELLRLDPNLSRTDSPFLAQNLETRAFVECCLHRWDDPEAVAEDEKQLLVLFDQCREAVERIHRRSAQAGTSLQLTYKLQCLRDHICRGEQLANIAGELQRDRSGRTAYPSIISLFKTLVFASCRKNDLRTFWRQNLEITARRVTEYAGKAGEHYITEGRKEYFSMAKAAMGAGVFIALMAMIKLALHHAHLAPLNEMIAYGLNYGLGFVLIYMIGFTVATKQPAMTANALAASIGEAKGKVRDLENLITLIARTTRSQIVAILGNVSVAIPMAIGVSMLAFLLTGQQAIPVEEADKLMAGHHPFTSGALIFAGVAGVCLFLSGLIAGYFDNLATYNRIPQRIKQLAWARRFLGEERLGRFADYVERNLGALASNFLFGMMLGSAWGIGMLLGLPIDIRHVAFSSAYLGYAAAAYDFSPPLAPFIWASVGVAGIGLVNLSVSFSLALFVALRARGVTFSQGRQLMRGLLRRLLTHPRDFFLPPKKQADDLVQ